jgi:RND family efflux transporter MFP subunit
MVVSALILAGCGGKEEAAAPQAPKVTVATPLVKQIVDWDDYVGRFEAVQTVEIRPRVSGYLMKVHFDDGQAVKKGEVLFTIDQRPFTAKRDEARGQLEQVKATLANLKTQLARQQKLLAIKAVSKEEFETLQSQVKAAEAQLTGAQAAVRAAELDVDFTEVKAPVDGRVSYRRVDVGNAVTADNTVLTTVTAVDPIRFVFEGSEALYLKYKRGKAVSGAAETPVRIRLQDESSYDWKGHLDFMDTMINNGTGTIRGYAVVENPNGFLVPGMFGHMQLQGSAPYDGIMIPDTAVATQAGERVVYVVDSKNVVSVKPVELGPLNEGLRVIRSGLDAKDRVIINGQQRAFPGQTVDPTVSSIETPKELAAGQSSAKAD